MQSVHPCMAHVTTAMRRIAKWGETQLWRARACSSKLTDSRGRREGERERSFASVTLHLLISTSAPPVPRSPAESTRNSAFNGRSTACCSIDAYDAICACPPSLVSGHFWLKAFLTDSPLSVATYSTLVPPPQPEAQQTLGLPPVPWCALHEFVQHHKNNGMK